MLFAMVMAVPIFARAQLSITPTFDSSITSLSDAAAVEAAINAAIAQTEANITTFHLDNVSIDFVSDPTTGLGSNISATNNLSYTQYLADLKLNPSKSALQNSAIATMPTGPLAALNNNTTMTLTASNLAAIGETALANAAIAGNGGLNGTIYLNLSIMNVSRTSGQIGSNYDLQSVAQHEIDEVLGIGGYGSTLYDPTAPLPKTLGSLDLFRYSANGVRSFTTSSSANAYFSVDGGKTVLVHFLQTGDGDYADYSSSSNSDNSNTPPNVQDAFATPYSDAPNPPNLGTNELTAFQVIGYNLVTLPSFWLGQIDGKWTNHNWATNLIGNPATSLPGPNSNITFSAAGAANQGNTLLGQNFTIHSLTISDPVAVMISSGTGGPFTLTISGTAGTGINVQSGAGLFTMNANLQFAGSSNTITVSNSAGAVVNGVISGTIGLTKTGTGILTLGAANTYTGNTAIQKGTVVLAANNALPATTNLTLGTASSAFTGSVDLAGHTLTVNSIGLASGNTGGTGNVITSSTGSGTLTVQSATTSSTYAGLLSGSLSLVKAGGAGTTLTLTAANTYTGSTRVNSGTLQIGTSSAAGSIANSSGVSVNNGSKLSLVNLTGKTFAVNVSNGVTGVGTLNFNSTATNTISGTLSDGAAGQLVVTQTGTGVSILSGNNTYTGATTISAGTLQVGDGTNGNLTGTSGVTISGTGALAMDLADGSSFANNVSLGATGTQLKAIAAGTNTLTGLISGTGGFTEAGTGTTILSVAEIYTGATNITTGTLEVDGSLASASVVNVGTAGTLSGTGIINSHATLTGNGVINFGSGGTIISTLAITGGNWNGQGTVDGLVTSSSGAFNLNGSLTAPAGLSVTGGTLASSGTLTGNLTYAGANTTFGGVVAGAGSTLTMNKASVTLTLSGNNTYTGATTISAGTLQIGNGTSGNLANTSAVSVSGTGVLATDLADGATFSQNVSLGATGTQLKAIAAGTNTLAGVISGLGGLTQAGTGKTVLAVAETYTGKTAITAGELDINGSLTSASAVSIATGGTLGGTGVVNGMTTLTGNGAIDFGSSGEIANTLTITGGNWNGLGTVTSLVTSSSGIFNLNGTLTALAGLNVTGGTLAGTGTLNGNLTYAGTTSTFGGVIAGAGSKLTVNKASNTLTLSGTNTYTGATTISAGTLQIGNGTSGSISGTSGVIVSGTGILAIDLADGASFSPNVSLGAAGTLVKTIEAGTNTLAGIISGSGGLTQAGSGITILSSAETYTGKTTVTTGELDVNVSLSSASAVSIATGGTLGGTGVVNGKTTLTGNGAIDFGSGGEIANTLTITGGSWNGLGTVTSLVTSSSGIFNLNGTLTVPAGLSVTGGTLAGTGTLNGNLTYAGTTSTFGGVIAGTGSKLTVNKASNTLTLSGTNTYTGATTISAGTLQIGNGTSGSISGTSNITASGTGALVIDLADGATFSNNILLSTTGTQVKAIQTGTTTLTSVIDGGGGFTQAGTGTTIVNAVENYTGKTTITSGTLEVDGSLATGSVVSVATGGKLTGSGTVIGKTTLTGNGIIDLNSAGTIHSTLGITGGNWNGDGTVQGLVTSSSGIFNLNGDLTAAAGLSVTGGTLAGTGTLTGSLTYAGVTETFGGTIAGTSSTLTMNKASVTLTLTGANTYTGGTTIKAGVIALGNGTTAGASLGSGNVTITSSGTLALNLKSGDTFANNVINAGKFNDTATTGLHTISGVISGAGTFTKSGSSIASLTQANTYAGATTISGGTLAADNSSGSATGTGKVTVNNGGILGGSGTVSGAITLNSGGTIAPGIETPLTGGTTLHATSLMWNSGGILHLNLGAAGDELTMTGALTKGGSGAYVLALSDVGITQSSYTLLNFASTTFLASNFTLQLPAGYTGSLVETSTSLSVNLTPIAHGEFAAVSDGTLTLNEPLVPPTQATETSSPLPTPLWTGHALATESSPVTNSTSLSLVATPEPSCTLLAGLGALALLGRRQRRS